jgi:hypothetical protein
MDVENIMDIQAEIVIDEGWSEDDSGLPVFTAGSIDAIENEMVGLRADEGIQRLKLAAVLTEASERRFYGDNTLQKVCKENQIAYSTGRKIVAGYKRLRSLPIEDRTTFVSALLSGELYWSKVEITAPVEDDQEYTELLHASADGSLSNSKLRKRVSSLSGQKAIDSGDEDDEELPEPIRVVIDARLELERLGSDFEDWSEEALTTYRDELSAFVNLLRRVKVRTDREIQKRGE